MTTAPSTTPGSQPRAARPPYRLSYEPDDRSWTARENLTDILARELLGPAGGADEVLEGSPDVAYLVGRIAPARLSDAQPASTAADLGEEGADVPATDVGDALDATEGRGVPLASVVDAEAGSDEDGTPDDDPQKRGLMIPASMGLRFQVPADLDAFTVTATWGVYHVVRGEGDEAGSRRRRYQREPVEVAVTVSVAGVLPGETTVYPLRGDVVLRVDRHDDPERGRLVVEVALCNDRVTPRRIPVDAWLYQTRLDVEAGGEAVFLPVSDAQEDPRRERNDELRRLRLQYRDRLEFAVGRTCSVDWEQVQGRRRARRVWTTWLPVVETPQTAADEVADALLDMTELATAAPERLEAGLRPIVNAYQAWLDGEQRRAGALPEHLREDGEEAVAEARKVQRMLAAGLDHLLADPEALRCFRFMNAVMSEQRVHTQVSELRAKDPKLSIAAAREAVFAGPAPHHWRSFQLAFVLMQLPLLSRPDAAYRSGPLAKAQLLFFPTGGGKTEAYLGLAAYTFAVRRRQGVVESADGPLDGRTGVAVLMRYTLRLLTAQQFQRATALVCAAELERRKDAGTWGEEPFRIGLWVGTDVSPKRFDEAAEELQRLNEGRGYRLTVLQIQRCPWCGSRVTGREVKADKHRRRVFVRCSDELAECPFAEGGAVDEGLPVLTVDEEIYRLAPGFVIATVDKFARLAREGEAASLFGYVSRRCGRHGFVHPDSRYCTIKDDSRHRAESGLPPARLRRVGRLRPPDLVVQDELHLITGPLGTTVGLFETAVDVLSSWATDDGSPVRPLLVASTATARNARDQVRMLYGRDITIFPPQVLDAGHTFFSEELPVSAEHPGRRYVGVSTTGVRMTTAEIRVAEVLLTAGQLLVDRCGDAADPYLTLVGYFNAIRELAGMARYVGDDIQTAISRGRPWSQLPTRTGTHFGSLHLAELTSRVSSADITRTLDEMAVPFSADLDSTAGKQRNRELREPKQPAPQRELNPYDVVLATSMLQVGVDVPRLGLMLVVGQPKNTAEYIQASSRVGRVSSRPGLVVTLGNWARPRDLAHFEQFRHYHETFYAQVEALSVTPFSLTSLDRGLSGVLVSGARVLQAVRGAEGLSPERGAGRIHVERAFAEELVGRLVDRVAQASGVDDARQARQRLIGRLDEWEKRRELLRGDRKSLVYEWVPDEAQYGPLMVGTEVVEGLAPGWDRPPFAVPNSMREVQPEINLLVSPIRDRLIWRPAVGTPDWQMPQDGGPGTTS